MENLTKSELIHVIKNYINENYGYDYADFWEDELTYHYDNETKWCDITINIKYGKEDK